MNKKNWDEQSESDCINFIYENLQLESKLLLSKERILIVLYKYGEYESYRTSILEIGDPLNKISSFSIETTCYPNILELFEEIGLTITLDLVKEILDLEEDYKETFDWSEFEL